MTIVKFQQEHFEIVKSWFDHYGIVLDIPLPKIGFIAIDGEPIAAAFLRQIEGGCALFDGLIANPKSCGKRRNKALNTLVETLMGEARRLDIKKILGYSHDTAVVRRSLKHGFEILPDQLIAVGI